MADGVLSIRVSDEIQEKFKGFVESSGFRNQGAFMEHLLTRYAAQETGCRIPTLEGAISAVNELSERISKVLIGAGEAILASQEGAKKQAEAQMGELGKQLEEAKGRAAALARENEALKAALENLKAELAEAKERETGLGRILDDKAALIDGYREKIGLLEAEAGRQRLAAGDAEDMRAELESLRAASNEQALRAGQMEIERGRALVELEARLRQEMGGLQSMHSKTVMEYESRTMGLIRALEEKDRACMELEAKYRQEAGKHQNALRSYETELLNLRRELDGKKSRS